MSCKLVIFLSAEMHPGKLASCSVLKSLDTMRLHPVISTPCTCRHRLDEIRLDYVTAGLTICAGGTPVQS